MATRLSNLRQVQEQNTWGSHVLLRRPAWISFKHLQVLKSAIKHPLKPHAPPAPLPTAPQNSP